MTNPMHFSSPTGRRQTVKQADGTVDMFPTKSEPLFGKDLDSELLSSSFVRNHQAQIPHGCHIPGGTNPLEFFNTSNDGPWHPKGFKTPGREDGVEFQTRGSDFPNKYRYNFSTREFDTEPMPSDSGYASHGPQSLADQSRLSMDLSVESIVPSVPRPPIPTARELTCETCHKVLKTNSEFQKHRQRHTKPHKCQVPGCSRTEGFSTLNDLDRHVRSIHPQAHTSGNRYRCTLQGCRHKEKLWPRADNFRSHLKRVHQQIISDEEMEQFVYRAPPEVLPDIFGMVPSFMKNPALEIQTFFDQFPDWSDQGRVSDDHTDVHTPSPGYSDSDEGSEQQHIIQAYLDYRGSPSMMTTGADEDLLPKPLHTLSNPPEGVSPEPQHHLSDPSQEVVPETLNALSDHPEDVLSDTVRILVTASDLPQNKIKPSGYDPTDSGYGSMPSLTNNQEARETASNLPESKTSAAESDAGTVLSAATAMDSGIIHESLTCVCEAIYRELQPEVDRTSFMERVENLGELIKAFAIQLGLDQSDDMGPTIMYFVYKHHKDICVLLEAMFKVEDENGANSPKDRSGDMSIAEKMEIWHPECPSEDASIQEDTPYFADKGCQFEGVADLEDDEPITTSELSVYSKVIFKSSAYRWLVSTLKQHASLSHGDAHAAMASDEIRQTVLRHLQTGTISRKQLPTTSTASIVLSGYLNTLKARLHHDIIPGTGVKLEDIVVLVASSETHVQLSTVGRYMRQVWQESGVALLRGFQELVNRNCTGDCVTVEQDPLSIEINSLDVDIRVECEGPSYLISQCAAQLAWMNCALRFDEFQPAVCTPRLIKTEGAEFAVSYVEQIAEEQDILAYAELCGQLQPASIHEMVSVWGFPTAWRPEDFLGVEIPLDLTYNSVYSYFQESGNRLILNVGGATAYFVKRKNNIWLWHLTPSLGDTCPCLAEGLEYSNRATAPRGSELHDLYHHRHIFSRCHQSCRPSQDWNTRSTQEEDICSNRDGNRIMTKSPGWGSLESDFPTKQSIESDSIDTDLLSISSFSCDDEDRSLELRGDLAAIVESAAHHILSRYQQRLASITAPCDGDSTDNSPGTTSSSGQIPSSGSVNSGVRSGKRKANDGDEKDENASRQNHRPEKQPKIDESSSNHNFACPFWKFDPAKYRACIHKKLVNSSRVKQHLNRHHIPRFYCQYCYAIFEEKQIYEQHVVQRSCERLPGARLDGISREQQEILSKKPKSKQELSEEQKWYRIWDIVLPDYPQPGSPYINSQLTDYYTSFREYCHKPGVGILERHIESSGIFPHGAIDEATRAQLLQGVLARGLDMICDSWLLMQQNTSLQLPVTPAYTQDYSSRGSLSSTTRSSFSAGIPMNLQGDVRTNSARRRIGQTDSAIADSSMVDPVGANATSASLEPMPPELSAPAPMQTYAPLRDPDDFFSVYDATFPPEGDHSAAEFEDILNWPNP